MSLVFTAAARSVIMRSTLALCLVVTREHFTGMDADRPSSLILSTCKRCFTLYIIVSCADITLS